MKFVIEHRGERALWTEHPFVVLQADNWNDYGFITLFNAIMHVSSSKAVELGPVKILRLGLSSWHKINR